ncbi:MAG: hypothetical protein IK116_02250 [Firmicutes bacterium]|nr:hypothetical protein [Bacillota bacterium]
MNCDVFLADSRQAVAAGRVTHAVIPVEPFDVEVMGQNYYKEKKALQQGFEQFRERWLAEWHDLPRPQAGLIRWQRQELREDFIPTFDVEKDRDLREALDEQCDHAYAAVWTIGAELEETAEAYVATSTLQAMFLDVAGSLLMGNIRKALHTYVSSLNAAGLTVLGEHIPEISERDPRLRRIAAPWSEAPVQFRPGFTLGGNGVLHPLKSQCAMFFIGQPQPGAKVRLDEIPCSSCKGSKCLYRQFGGCHLPLNRQPQPPRRRS